MITEEDRRLMEEVKKDLNAYQRLKDKANWEHMSLFAILKDYGDPRRWEEE